MTKRSLLIAGLILASALIALTCPISVQCPIHDYSQCYFTGATKIIDGVLVGVYHCPRNHDVLARCN